MNGALIPNTADVALSPSVHAIITDDRTDFIVTRQTFVDTNLMQTLPSIGKSDDERMVQVELSKSFKKDHRLLAPTVFYCDACRIDLFYPQVLVHCCPKPSGVIVVEYSAWNTVRQNLCVKTQWVKKTDHARKATTWMSEKLHRERWEYYTDDQTWTGESFISVDTSLPHSQYLCQSSPSFSYAFASPAR